MLSCVQLCNPVDLAHPAPLSMVFFRQEYWSGLPFSSPGDLPDPGMEPMCLVSTCFSRHIPYHLGSPLKVSVQFSHSVVSNSLWPHGLQHTRVSLSNTNSCSLFEFMSIELVMSSNHLILCHALLLLPLIIPSSGSFQWVSSLHQVAKLLEFQL